MLPIQKLTEQVATARTQYLDQIAGLTEAQARWKPAPEVWNVIENTAHLFWAEQGGIYGMWKTLHPISGALDFQQRLEFLRFHIDRHRGQVARLLEGMPS